MPRGYRFQQFHIRLLGGNNEITVSGEELKDERTAHDTVAAIWDGLGTEFCRRAGIHVSAYEGPPPPYTQDSLQPPAK